METKTEAQPHGPGASAGATGQLPTGHAPGPVPAPLPSPQAHPVGIVVNNKPVTLPDHKTSGLAIKETAVAQGVAIKIDFVLFRLTGATQHQVRDADQITVRNGEEFRAVAADDNSGPPVRRCR